MADLTLDPPTSTGDLAGPPALDDDWLVLSTVHSAKGGEWAVVHILHAADGCFPSDLATGDAESLEEERRLFYVAVTRARDVLEVDVPLRFHRHRDRLDDLHGFAPISRFLSPAVVGLMGTEHASSPVADADALPHSVGVAAAPGVEVVDSLLADLWA